MNSLLDRVLLIGVSGIAGLLLATSTIAQEPEFRPALVGNGPHSLVNLIDLQKLLANQHQDAVVMFDLLIFPFRVKGNYGSVYRSTPGSQFLQKAVLAAVDKAEFIPAIAHQKPASVDFHGTVMFFAKEKPNLRVFANQDGAELAHLADFVAPQLIGGSAKFDSKDSQLDTARRLHKTGTLILSLHVNEKGALLSSKVVSEHPPGLNFGAVALKSYATARFIPGFRNGRPLTAPSKPLSSSRRMVVIVEELVFDETSATLQPCCRIPSSRLIRWFARAS